MGLDENVVEHEPSPYERARKRARYTQIAWYARTPQLESRVALNTNELSNECKRRKLKCSGGETCTRCDRDNVTCVYDANRSSTHPPEFKDSRYDRS